MRIDDIATVAVLIRAGLETTQIYSVFKLARRIHTFNVNALNRPITARERRSWERDCVKLRDICKPRGIEVDVNGDPRGWSVGLILPSGLWNGGDRRDGWRIDPELGKGRAR